jgi:hypothetical protein
LHWQDSEEEEESEESEEELPVTVHTLEILNTDYKVLPPYSYFISSLIIKGCSY